MPDPIKQKPKYIDAPITKRIYSNEPIGTKGTSLDSQYDLYTNPANIGSVGVTRATLQPWYDQLGNNAAKLIPAIGLGIVENAGYIGELFDSNQDYTNALTEWATKGRQGLEGALPTYRQNPNEVFDLTDSGWWAQHGLGLFESIGEFFVTGAGVGSATSAAAKGIASAVKAGKVLSGGLQATAQLGTASTLAYTEGAISGAQIYKEVYDHEIKLHGNIDQAKTRAAQAASETVKLNTILNTGLNVTALSPLFKTMNSMQTATRLGLNRKAGEKLSDWATRLGQLEQQGIIQPNFKKVLLREAGQEALEEDVNLYAESEGRITGGLEKASDKDPFQRFLNKVFTEEGALNAILGAVGGVGQTTAINHLPYRTDENGNRVSNSALATLQQNEAAKGLIVDLKADIEYITTKQKELNRSLEQNDKEAVQKAKEDLFNIAALRAIRNGNAQEFAETIKQIGLIDNTQVGEDGKTEAMRLGYADSTEDNDYKTIAARKAHELTELGEEYERVGRLFNDKFTTDQVFRHRLDIYSAQETVDKLDQENTKLTNATLKLVTDPIIAPIVSESAQISAVNAVINSLESRKDLTPLEERMLGNLRNTNMINTKLMTDALKLDPSLKAKLTENAGVVKTLTQNRVPLISLQEEVRQLKGEYNKLLDNPRETTKTFKDVKEAIVKQLQKKETDKKITEEKAQEVKDKEDAKIQKQNNKTKYREIVGEFAIISNPEGGFDIVDEEAGAVMDTQPTLELAKAKAQEFNKRSKEESKGEPYEVTPIVIDKKPSTTDGTTQIKTKEIKDREQQLEKETIQQGTINENVVGKANKIAYRAKEDNTSGVNPQYLILHSSKFKVGTKVTLKVATETSFYKPDLPNNKVPIGVYHKGNLVGFVHVLGDNEKNVELSRIRDYVIANETVETTIVDKDLGVLNKGTKQTTSDNLPQVKTFVIAKDDGKIYTAVGKSYSSPKLMNKSFISGITYAIVTTPNDKEFAIALDTKRLSPEIVKSVMIATRIFLNPELTETENALLDEIFEKFDVDIRTPQGYKKYFKMFLYDYDLTDKEDIASKIQDKNDKRWVNFAGNGIRFLRSGGQVYEVGKNSPEAVQESLLNQLESHIGKMFFNVDLELLQDNTKVSLPIFTVDGKQNLSYTEYNKKSYKDHIADTTETDVVQFQINDKEYGSFVSPKIYFNTSFLGTTEEENYGKKLKKPKKKAILAPEKQEPEKPKKKFKSMTKRLPTNKLDEGQVTDDNVDERIILCE